MCFLQEAKMLNRILYNYIKIRRRHTFTVKELEQESLWKLKRLVRYAWLNVPFYSRKMRQAGLTPDEIHSLDDLAKLPIIPKSELMSQPKSEVLAHNMHLWNVLIRHTTGTTGKPSKIFWSNAYADYVTALRFVNTWRLGIGLNQKVMNIEFYGPQKIAPSKGYRVPNPLREVKKATIGPWVAPGLMSFRWKKLGFQRSVEEMVEEVIRFKPAGVFSRASYLRKLGKALESYAPRPEINKVLITGEIITESCKKDIHASLGSEVFETYGAMEFGSIGLECAAHDGLHLQPHLIVEVLKDGHKVGPGESGEVVITNLENTLMPFIRYKLGDIAVVGPSDGCECGSRLARLSQVVGRPQEVLVTPAGTRVYSREIIRTIERQVGVTDFQIEQNEAGDIRVRLPPCHGFEVIKSDIVHILKGFLGEGVPISCEVWNQDFRIPKYRPVFSRRVVA